ncbi:hypothetical protein [Anaeromicrobium sediminis]|uniref:DUF5673 domain-containing protein n=1 Tax=Anaeromicrobium sediminis TaxID=1478221 RepID=A0A267MI56_9FIRM|nr:hypothetical protein [Anaeromicrobium sediminis]PAB59261.1 hypothetical protein CCE28_10365 [Anaeromicrobium sediminis]
MTEKIKYIINMVAPLVMLIIYFFYRENIMAVGIGLGLLWCAVIIRIIDKRKKALPKPNYYIENPVVYRYFRWAMVIIISICFIISIYLYLFQGEEFNLTVAIFFPLVIINTLDFERRIYLYEGGIVWCGEILEFNHIKAFIWKEERAPWEDDHSNNLLLSYKDKEYTIVVPQIKRSYIDKILKFYIKNRP